MTAITWRNQVAPSFADSVAAQRTATDAMNNAFKQLSGSTDYFRDNNIADTIKQGAAQDLNWLTQANQFTNRDTLQSDLAGIAVGKQADKAKIAEYMLKRPGQLSDMAINRQNIAQNQFKLYTNQGNLDRSIESHNSSLAKDRANIFSSNASADAARARTEGDRYDLKTKKDVKKAYDGAVKASDAFYNLSEDNGGRTLDVDSFRAFASDPNNNINPLAADKVVSEWNARSGKTARDTQAAEEKLKAVAPTINANAKLIATKIKTDALNKATKSSSNNRFSGTIATTPGPTNIPTETWFDTNRGDVAKANAKYGALGVSGNILKTVNQLFSNGEDYDEKGANDFLDTVVQGVAAGKNQNEILFNFVNANSNK